MNPLSSVLHSLSAHNAEEVSLLRSLLGCVSAMHRRVYADLGLTPPAPASQNMTLTLGYSASEELLAAIPAPDKRYFDGLVEAFEIYRTIHGRSPAFENPAVQPQELEELRRIRDLCLNGGIHSAH